MVVEKFKYENVSELKIVLAQTPVSQKAGKTNDSTNLTGFLLADPRKRD
jgi:hypothetical protein